MTDWSPTFKCNDNCVSCINNTEIACRASDPPLKQIFNILEKINPKTDYLGLSGGEPTLRKEFFKILKYARERHPDLYILILTNGRMFSYKKFAKKLASLNLGNFMVAVALYGHNEEIHESITRSKGSFLQTTNGIRNLLSFGIPVEVRTIINKINYKYMENFAKFVAEEFPTANRVVFVNMKVTGNALKNRDQVLVKISEVVPYVEKAVKILQDKKIETRLFHFPLCVIPENLWNLAKGITKREIEELTFVEECEKCLMQEECPRIWKSYVEVVGCEEFRAINPKKVEKYFEKERINIGFYLSKNEIRRNS
ncbi:MAG: radical SAM protein [Candidatus Anstonellales archaeon]